MKINWLIGLCLSALFCSCCGPKEKSETALIPLPKNMQPSHGNYVIESKTKIACDDETLMAAGQYLANKINMSTGWDIETINAPSGDINLKLDTAMNATDEYRLEVTTSGIQITGQSYRGVLLGIQTLRQLLPSQIEQPAQANQQVKWDVPAVSITDYPTSQWRGLMLDVSRHFFTPAEVKELLDLMALYKLNKFHWHLTDDQGWRIEIKKYPLLTQKGGFRQFNSHDKECLWMAKSQDNPDLLLPADRLQVVEGDTIYGGYYTQEEIKEIVAYASQLGIDVIPEIDMPGHFTAAIANYPYLSCFNRAGWGHTFSAPICPGKDEVLRFCEDIYSELIPLFPYDYFHLGADEVEKGNWEKCPNCQKRIKKEGLSNEHELQAWFVKSMEKFLNANGKKLIGWDEILEGGLSETATIMWWRSWEKNAVHKATAQGNHAILTPNSHFYFDYAPDSKTLANVYSFNPALDGLDNNQTDKIQGVQANIWAEWIPSRERMQYMIFPRLTALAEVAWGTADMNQYGDYTNRLLTHYKRWDIMGINYRIPDLEGFNSKNVFTDQAIVKVNCQLPTAIIRYTTDGSIPTAESPLYTEPITISQSTNFAFRTFRQNGTADAVVKTQFAKQTLAEPVNRDKSSLTAGLLCKIYEKKYENCENFTDGAKLIDSLTVDKVAIPQGAGGWLGLSFEGYIEIPQDGVYTFALFSDDGSRLYVDGYFVCDNDGAHSPRELTGQYAMKAGLHAIGIHYFDGNNGGQLGLKIFSPANTEMVLNYFH